MVVSIYIKCNPIPILSKEHFFDHTGNEYSVTSSLIMMFNNMQHE